MQFVTYPLTHPKSSKVTKFLNFCLGTISLMLLLNPCIAQVTDTSKIQKQKLSINSLDSLKVKQLKTIPKYHSPKKAALFSMVLPGLGQAYNKKYWKLPVIYVGAAGLSYLINFEQTNYIKYRTAYKYRIDGDPLTIDNYVGKYTDESLNNLQTFYHRYRDLSVIAAATLYLLNIIDASVDAHLFTFDVSDDLSFKIHPALINTAHSNQFITGLSFVIKL